MSGKKPVLLEQPLMSVWASDISAKFRLTISTDSSGDLIFTGSLSSPACHFAQVRPSFRAAAPVSKQLSEVSQFYLHSPPCLQSLHFIAGKTFYQWPLSLRWDYRYQITKSWKFQIELDCFKSFQSRTKNLKICMETQKTLNSQSNLEGKKRSWRNQTP